MECEEVRRKFIEYLDGDLPDKVCRAVSDHLAECYMCTENLDDTRTMLRMSESAIRHPCPVYKLDALSVRLFPPVRHYPVQPRVRVADVLRRLLIAAMVILAVSISPMALHFIRWTVTPAPNNDILSNGSGRICKRLAVMRPAIEWRWRTLRVDREIFDDRSVL